jgi:hypothetical protein
MENTLEYWKKRCELAENIINTSLEDPGIELVLTEWENFIMEANRPDNEPLVDDLYAPISEEERQKAMKWLDEVIIPDNWLKQQEKKCLELFIKQSKLSLDVMEGKITLEEYLNQSK